MRPSPLRPRRSAPSAVRAAASLLSLAASLGACASSSGGAADTLRNPAAGVQVPTRITGGATLPLEVRAMSNAVEAVEARVPVGPDKAFAALPGVYEELGLTINAVLSDSRTLGMRDGRPRRRLGKQPLSRYLDCGVDPNGTRHADAWTVTLTVLSRVAGSDVASSTVSTQLAATAAPLGTSGSAVNCSSTGMLEKAIHDALTVQAAAQL